MLSKILVPLDGSRLSDRILNQVRRLLIREDAQVMLLRVLPEPLRYPPDAERRSLVETAQRHLESLCADLSGQGASASYSLVDSSDPAAKILQFAKRYRPSLIAMTTHGDTGLKRWFRGSVAERVLRHAEQPLLLWNPFRPSGVGKGGGPRFGRILVPLDGSSRAAEVLPLVKALGEQNASRVTLLHVQPLVPVSGEPPGMIPLLPPERARALLVPFRKRLGDLAVRIRTEVGVPGITILDVAQEEHADLVALATHGRTGAARWAFGSVAEQVLRHCPLPMLVVRTGGAGAAE